MVNGFGVLEFEIEANFICSAANMASSFEINLDSKALFQMLHPNGFKNLSYNIQNQTTDYEDSSYPDFSQISSVRIVFVCLFLLEFVVCVVGNVLVCLTVYRTKAMHSPVNYYIVNLGICDFLVGAFVLPTKLFELTAESELSMLNDAWCTVVRYLETIVVFTGVFTLVAICVERYYAVVYPVQSRMHLTYSRIGRILFLVWIIPCTVAAPNLYPASATVHHLYSHYGEFTRTTCFDRFTDDFRRGYFIFLFFCMYFVPVLFIGTTCYGIFKVLMQPCIAQPHLDPRAVAIEEGRRKVARMVLVVVFAFVTCWSPYFLVTVVTQLQTENFLTQGQFFFTMLCINLLGFANSCVNPIVYFAMSKRFRKGYTNILRSLLFCCASKKEQEQSFRLSPSSLRRTSRQGTRTTNDGCLFKHSGPGVPSQVVHNDDGSNTVQPTPSAVLPRHKRLRKGKRSLGILIQTSTKPLSSPAPLIPLHVLSSSENVKAFSHLEFS